jgi:hypothetical protein
MDHQQAVAGGLTERYLLGELEEAEREAFEAHFFGCVACAEDVKAGAAVVDGVRGEPAVRGFEARPPARSGLRALFWPLPLGAAAALALSLGWIGYQGLRVIPDLRRELREAEGLQAPASYFLYASRAEPPILRVPAGGRRILIRLSTTFERPFARYRCQLRDAAGNRLQAAVMAAPPAGEELQIQLPVKDLPSGSYEIVLDGLDASDAPAAAPELARYRFALRHEKE